MDRQCNPSEPQRGAGLWADRWPCRQLSAKMCLWAGQRCLEAVDIGIQSDHERRENEESRYSEGGAVAF